MDPLKTKILIFSCIVALLALAGKQYVDQADEKSMDKESKNMAHNGLNAALVLAFELYYFSLCDFD